MPVNPSSVKQNIVRARFGNLSQQWRGLTAAQRLAWNTQAPSIVLVDSLGQQYTPTGQQFFVGINNVRVAVGLSISTTPPASQTQAVITTFTVTAVGSTGVVTATFAPAIAASSFYELLATAPTSAGRGYVGRSEFKTLAYLTNTDTSPYVATSVYAAAFGSLAAGDAGKAIFFRLRPISSNGFQGTYTQYKATIS